MLVLYKQKSFKGRVGFRLLVHRHRRSIVLVQYQFSERAGKALCLLLSSTADEYLTCFPCLSSRGSASAGEGPHRCLAPVLQASATVAIPKEHHRFVIGKNGEKLQDLELKTATKIQIPRPDDPSNQIKITGTKEGIEKARHEILLISAEQVCEYCGLSHSISWTAVLPLHGILNVCSHHGHNQWLRRARPLVPLPSSAPSVSPFFFVSEVRYTCFLLEVNILGAS